MVCRSPALKSPGEAENAEPALGGSVSVALQPGLSLPIAPAGWGVAARAARVARGTGCSGQDTIAYWQAGRDGPLPAMDGVSIRDQGQGRPVGRQASSRIRLEQQHGVAATGALQGTALHSTSTDSPTVPRFSR